MRRVPMLRLREDLTDLIWEVGKRGSRVLITSHGRAVAMLVPPLKRNGVSYQLSLDGRTFKGDDLESLADILNEPPTRTAEVIEGVLRVRSNTAELSTTRNFQPEELEARDERSRAG